ncbi:MAG: pyridoxal-phosphate dependent enzyme [Planctomycetaceae bacterium]|nr:pyridoxal-phosphate dependent enzyme [Planctomycetaceae bacterium]
MNTTDQQSVCFNDIRQAASRIQDYVLTTPAVPAETLSRSVGADLFFKCENLQHIGAFKARGACNAVLQLTDEQAAAGVVTHSSGNHAAALARAARTRGIAAHIVMPHNSSAAKIAAVRGLGVEPRFCEPTAAARAEMADQVAAETGATLVHPYNDPHIIAGQGTATLEFLQQVTDLDVLVVPVGGGGLASGALIAARALQPDLEVIGAEPAWADDAIRSLKAGSMQPPERFDSIADGLRAPLGSLTYPIISQLIDDILPVSEDMIREATRQSICQTRLVVEPSGAVPLGAVLANGSRFAGRRVGLIISGGNAELDVFARILSSSE